MNPQIRRLALDLGPLLKIFFAAFKYLGIFGATAAFMAAVLLALAIGYLMEKRLSPMPLFTAVLVMVFGGLTLYLKNDIFIKMKPTVLYAFFWRRAAGRSQRQPAFHQICFRPGVRAGRIGLEKIDRALGHLLPGPGGPQRNHLALHHHRDLGIVQGMGHHSPDLPVRARTDPALAQASAPRYRRYARLMRGRHDAARAIFPKLLAASMVVGAPKPWAYKALCPKGRPGQPRMR